MAGGSEDLRADTFPWTPPRIDLPAPSPPQSGVQGYRLTQGPGRTISKQAAPSQLITCKTDTQSARAGMRRSKLNFWPGLQGAQVVGSS